MKTTCANLLLNEMNTNDRIRVVTADSGFGVLDDIQQQHKDRFYNVGSAEQLMIGIGIGMAEEGLIPVCYSISSFLLNRPFELLRNYVNAERIPVKMLGIGRDKDYDRYGLTHWSHDDQSILAVLPNIRIYKPKSINELNAVWDDYINSPDPAYLNLRRE